MYEREKGHEDSQRKHQTITLWLFQKNAASSVKGYRVDELLRGAIVVLRGEPGLHYLVMAVFEKHYNKYFMRSEKYGAAPQKVAKGSPVKLGLRRVVLSNAGIEFEWGKPYNLDLPVCESHQNMYSKLVPASMVDRIVLTPTQDELDVGK
jgi:hypothetical protein